jgi:hypothetical protein
MLEDVAGSRTFSMASPDPVTSVTCVQFEPAFICEEHRAPVVNLPISVFSGKKKKKKIYNRFVTHFRRSVSPIVWYNKITYFPRRVNIYKASITDKGVCYYGTGKKLGAQGTSVRHPIPSKSDVCCATDVIPVLILRVPPMCVFVVIVLPPYLSLSRRGTL